MYEHIHDLIFLLSSNISKYINQDFILYKNLFNGTNVAITDNIRDLIYRQNHISVPFLNRWHLANGTVSFTMQSTTGTISTYFTRSIPVPKSTLKKKMPMLIQHFSIAQDDYHYFVLNQHQTWCWYRQFNRVDVFFSCHSVSVILSIVLNQHWQRIHYVESLKSTQFTVLTKKWWSRWNTENRWINRDSFCSVHPILNYVLRMILHRWGWSP